jgi:hypothetical protein
MHIGMIAGHFTSYYLVWIDRSLFSFSGFHYLLGVQKIYESICCLEYRSCGQSFISLLILLLFPVATFCWVCCTFCNFLASVEIFACCD